MSTTTPAASDFPILVIDTASPTTSIGLGTAPDEWIWRSDGQEAGVALFASLESVLAEARVSLESIRCLAFCEGPGSMLGIRTAVMAIRTWMATGVLLNPQLRSYSSLALANACLRDSGEQGRCKLVIDARRQSWHCLETESADTTARPVQRFPHDEMAAAPGPVFLPEGFPVWNTVPDKWNPCRYSPKILVSEAVRNAILKSVSQAEAWQPEPPSYQKWVPTFSRSPQDEASTRKPRP